MEKLISIYNNPQRGYVFCVSTTILNKKLHTNVRPIIMLSLEEVEENWKDVTDIIEEFINSVTSKK